MKKTTLFREAKIKPADMQGREWDVTIIGAETPADIVTIEGEQFVLSKNNRLYSVDSLIKSTPMWDGVKVFDNHLTDTEFQEKQGMRSPKTEWLGTIVKPVWDAAAKQIKGTFKVVEDALAQKLKRAWEGGILNSIGLSIDAFPIIDREINFQGEDHPVIEGFNEILSVDLVGNPAAGGGFNRILAADIKEEAEEATMNAKAVEEMIDAKLEGIGDIVKAAITDALPAPAEEVAEGTELELEAVEVEAEEEEAEIVDPVAEMQAEVKALESRMVLRDRLDAAKLESTYREAVEEVFAGQVFDPAKLDATIEKMQKAQAAKDTTGRVSESDSQRGKVDVGMTPDEKLEVEFMRLVMGSSDFRSLEHKKEDFVQDRVKEGKAYKSWLNAGKPNTGNYRRLSNLIYDIYGHDPLLDNRALEAATTTTLSTVVKNTVNIFTAADYSLQERWYEDIVKTEEVDTIDTTTLARLYGLDTLAVVEEGAAYASTDPDDEEETATFVKRGNYISVTLETMMRDKLNYIRTIPRRLSDTWFNTLSSQTAAVFTTNTATGPVLGTTGALFNATAATSAGGHANLLTTALSHASYSAARTAMRKQTNQPLGTGQKAQIGPKFLLVPEDLETAAWEIRNSELEPGTANNDRNRFFEQFEIRVVPNWTDTNNWALAADPARWPAIYHIFPRGNRTPQIFTADNETTGALFTNDSLRFKVRMMTFEFSSTYRVSPVADFRPLHKSNVA